MVQQRSCAFVPAVSTHKQINSFVRPAPNVSTSSFARTHNSQVTMFYMKDRNPGDQNIGQKREMAKNIFTRIFRRSAPKMDNDIKVAEVFPDVTLPRRAKPDATLQHIMENDQAYSLYRDYMQLEPKVEPQMKSRINWNKELSQYIEKRDKQ